MIEIICGEKGKGKTKKLLEKVNHTVSTVTGSVVYLDKSQKHMYELNNQICLINVTNYPIYTYEGFIGFVSGLLSGNHDIECVFIDSLIKVAHLTDDMIADAVSALEKLSKEVQFVCSISVDESVLDTSLKEKIIVSC